MRYKSLKLSAVLLFGLGLTVLQAQTMYVKESNDTQISYVLSNVCKMTFSSGNVTVQKTDNTKGVYALDGLKYLSFNDFTTAIDEQQIQAGNTNLIAYPNPVIDMLNIYFTDTKNNNGSISILTTEGKIVQTLKTSRTGIVKLNLSHLPQGIYICRYSNSTEIQSVKIIKK